jgi:hypothetical protein
VHDRYNYLIKHLDMLKTKIEELESKSKKPTLNKEERQIYNK